jgi:hypothetical protein
MDGLDNHYSALWVQNERRQAEGKPTCQIHRNSGRRGLCADRR